MRRAFAVYLIAFLMAFVFQWLLWNTLDAVIDGTWFWEPAITEMSHALPPLNATNQGYAEPPLLYPGMTILLPASALVRAGVQPDISLRIVLAVLVSLFTALAALLAYMLRPDSLWWIATVLILGVTRVYQHATPASVGITALLPCLALAFIAAYERRSWKWYTVLGLISGVCLSTRIDISAAVSGSMLLFLLFRDWRKSIAAGAVALGTLVLLDPYMRIAPLTHLRTIFENAAALEATHQLSLVSPLTVTLLPLGIVGFLLGAFLDGRAPNLLGISRPAAHFLLGLTAVLAIALVWSPYRETWYFFPLLSLWATLGGLFLLSLAQEAGRTHAFSLTLSEQSWSRLLITVLALSQIIAYSYPLLKA